MGMIETSTDADVRRAILDALEPHRNRREGSDRYNTPWRPGADGGTLTVTERSDYALGLSWYDHKDGTSGNGITLAQKLNIPLGRRNGIKLVPKPKPAYTSLDDYAQAHGIPADVLIRAGWRETQRRGGLAFAYPTDTGTRYRYADETRTGRKYDSDGGGSGSPCWYGLTDAVALAESSSGALVLCNGETSTLVAQAHGIPAACVTGGEKSSIKPELLDQLRQQWSGAIVIAFDCDQTGRTAGNGLATHLCAEGWNARAVDLGGSDGFDLADWCKLHPDRAAADVANLPELTQRKPGRPRQNAERQPRSARVLTDTDARHVIDITDENLGATSAAIWDGLLSSPYAEHLYRYGDRLLRVDPEQRSTELLDPRGERWRGMIARSCAFVRTSVTGASSECVPPVAMVTDAYVWHSHRVRTVDRIAHTPHLTASGSILSTPGYDAATRTLLLSDIEPLDLTVAQALTWIDELLCDFAFATPADRTNAIALLLLPFVRDLCDCTPLWLIDATRAGTGKTFLIEMLHRVWTGQAPEVRDLPLVPEEQRKALTAALVKQPVAVAFDDVSMVTGHALQRAITSPHWSDRELGSNRELTTTVRCVWLASGNNVTIGSDMVRRTVLIRMVSDLETPSERSDWRRDGDELKTWCTQHRRELVSACLTLAAAGQAYTRPVTARPMASFDAMVRVLTRTLTAAGITGFLDNAATLRTREHDGGAASWRMVFALWYRKYETKPITTAQVLHLVDECESGITVRGETERDRTNAIGKLISRQIETVSTVDGVTVQLVRANESRPPLWRLAVKTSAGSAGSAGLSLRTRAENKNNSPHTMHHGADNYLIISHGNGAVEPAEPAVPAEPATPQTNGSTYRGVYVTLFQARERWYANWNGASMDNRAEPHPDRETAYAYARQCIDAVRGLP